MTSEEEIRLLGHPVKVTLPRRTSGYIANRMYCQPKQLKSGTYEGYAVCDLDDSSNCSFDDIYLQCEDKLICLGDYSGLSYPVSNYVVRQQEYVTFDRIHKMVLLLYRRLEYLQEQLKCKVDRY